jgi:hypothetical protein
VCGVCVWCVRVCVMCVWWVCVVCACGCDVCVCVSLTLENTTICLMKDLECLTIITAIKRVFSAVRTGSIPNIYIET